MLNNPLTIWVMMEIIGFMFLTACSTEQKSIKSIPTILPMQFLASCLMMTGLIMQNHFELLSETLVVLSMMMKTGMYPFSNWMVVIFKEMNWVQCILMMTVMKMPALVMMSLVMKKVSWMMIIANTVSPLILVASVMPLTSTKKILAISSGIQSSWMINCIMADHSMWMMYFWAYTFSVITILTSIKEFNPLGGNQENPENHDKPEKVMMLCMILLLMGIPPTMMFILKAKLIMLITPNMMMPMSALIMSTSLSLMFYSRIIFLYMLCNYPAMKKIKTELDTHVVHLILMTMLLAVGLMY